MPEHLFNRPGYYHYYFGDYYGPEYSQRGIYPSFQAQRNHRVYDPIFVESSYLNRPDASWLSGRERIYQRDAAGAAHQRLPLMAKDVVADPKRPRPSVAMASVDGGRLQIRSGPSEPQQDSHWRESKVSVLETTPVNMIECFT